MALFAAGGVSIIVGGLVAAVTAAADWDHGSWVAAFLVLVAGVAPIGVGAGQARLARTAVSGAFAGAQCVAWMAACAVIIAGTLLSSPVTVSIGSAALLAALGMSLFAVRGAGGQRRLLRLAYRSLVIVLLVSVPIGVTLSWMRH